MDLRLHRTRDILKNDEFKQSVLGIFVSKDGITFCVHPAHLELSESYIQTENGEFSKEEILRKIDEFDNMINSIEPSIVILSTTISFPGPVKNDVVEITNWWSSGDNHFKQSDFSFQILQQWENQHDKRYLSPGTRHHFYLRCCRH